MAEPEAPAAPHQRSSVESVTSGIAGIADPAPLGLAAFALTTFLLSADNANLIKGSGFAWLGYALAYGGLIQLLAGMWEFRRGNVFGATAFSSYGGFWIGLWFYFLHNAPNTKDLGFILLAFAIFNTYMLLCATQVNGAVTAVFLTLELTEIFLFIGFLANNTNIIKIGGWIGILTAAAAWYASFAGVFNSFGGARGLPVGKPLMRI